MADGTDMAVSPLPTNTNDALIHLAIRLGGMEQAIRGSVTHDKLITILNDQRKEITVTVRDSEAHIKNMMEAQAALNATRQQELQQAQASRLNEHFTTLDSMLSGKVVEAVELVMAKRDQAEKKAREEIDNKAKDATRGFRLVMSGGGAIVGGALMLLGLFILKMTMGWSPFG